MKILWCVGQTAFGYLLMAATDRGVCRVQFGDSVITLLESLIAEFPNAHMAAADASDDLSTWFACLRDYLSAKAPMPDIPLSLAGTAFQVLVWRFLLSIPAGDTHSYTSVAKAIGRASAVRAVANACGQNPIALLVPCHRVLRADASLGGYRWGLALKRHLLDIESQSRLV